MSFINFKDYLDFNDGIYFEAEAADGENQSNTLFLETEKNWSGILMEPRNSDFQSLIKKKKYKNTFIGQATGNDDFFKLI